jgi:hypothetical protein
MSGDVKREWRHHAVEDLISEGAILVGDGYRAKRSELAKAGLPFARAGDVNNGFRFQGADRFPERDLDKAGAKVSQPGDVVFTSKIEQFCGSVTTDETMQQGAETTLLGQLGASFFVVIIGTSRKFRVRNFAPVQGGAVEAALSRGHPWRSLTCRSVGASVERCGCAPGQF